MRPDALGSIPASHSCELNKGTANSSPDPSAPEQLQARFPAEGLKSVLGGTRRCAGPCHQMAAQAAAKSCRLGALIGNSWRRTLHSSRPVRTGGSARDPAANFHPSRNPSTALPRTAQNLPAPGNWCLGMGGLLCFAFYGLRDFSRLGFFFFFFERCWRKQSCAAK